MPSVSDTLLPRNPPAKQLFLRWKVSVLCDSAGHKIIRARCEDAPDQFARPAFRGRRLPSERFFAHIEAKLFPCVCFGPARDRRNTCPRESAGYQDCGRFCPGASQQRPRRRKQPTTKLQPGFEISGCKPYSVQLVSPAPCSCLSVVGMLSRIVRQSSSAIKGRIHCFCKRQTSDHPPCPPIAERKVRGVGGAIGLNRYHGFFNRLPTFVVIIGLTPRHARELEAVESRRSTRSALTTGRESSEARLKRTSSSVSV